MDVAISVGNLRDLLLPGAGSRGGQFDFYLIRVYALLTRIKLSADVQIGSSRHFKRATVTSALAPRADILLQDNIGRARP